MFIKIEHASNYISEQERPKRFNRLSIACLKYEQFYNLFQIHEIGTNSGPFKEEPQAYDASTITKEKCVDKGKTADEQYTPTIIINLQVLDLKLQEREQK